MTMPATVQGRFPRATTKKITVAVPVDGTDFVAETTVHEANFDGKKSYHKTLAAAQQWLQTEIANWSEKANAPAARKNAKIAINMTVAKLGRKLTQLNKYDPTCTAGEKIAQALVLLAEAKDALEE